MMRSILGAALIGLSIIAMVADASPNQTQRTALGEEYIPARVGDVGAVVASGRYKMMPRSAWLDAGLMPVTYTQIDWFLEAELAGKKEAVSFDQPVKRRPAWEKVRQEVLEKMISKNLLTKKEPKTSGAPLEFYRPKQWDRVMQQNLSYRFGHDVNFCKARIVIRALKHSGSVSGDLRWMDEIIINLSNGEGC